MGPWTVWAIAVVVVFAGASFFFSLAETSLFSLNKWHIRQMAERSPKTGGIVQQLLAEPQDLLTTMVLGNTFASAGMLLIALWMTMTGLWSISWTVPSLLLLILVGGEVLPKSMAVRNPERWALRVATPMVGILTVSRPLSRLAQRINRTILNWFVPKTIKSQPMVTDADYQELLEMAYQQGALAQSEKEIILQIIRLDRRTVKEVMKPRSRMAAIADDCSIEEMLAAAHKHRHRRLPLYDETPDTIVGVLNTRTLLLDPAVDLADAIELPSFVPETMNLLHLFKSLQRQQRGLAIVLDEFGGTAGIVTMEDILEEVVGKIRGEIDAETYVMEKQAPGRWRVSGFLRLDDFRREYPPLVEVADVETLGGLMMSLMDVVPSTGDSVVYHGLKLTAQVTDERRIRELLIETIAKA